MTELWLITGVSSGLGRSMAIAALEAGFAVVGTVRNEVDARSFENLPGRAHARILDVGDHGAVSGVVEEIERTLGPVSVLVNNAGYGQEGPLEAIAISDLQRLYDVNLFGALRLCQAVIPSMRARGDGRIINISSATTLGAAPAIGAYSSSKAALNCLSEVLAKEVGAFGIKVTAVLPASFRTDWAGRSLTRTGEGDSHYGHLAETRAARAARDGRQAGDPARFAAAILALAADENPPLNLLLGASALRGARARIAQMEAEVIASEPAALATDFDSPVDLPAA